MHAALTMLRLAVPLGKIILLIRLAIWTQSQAHAKGLKMPSKGFERVNGELVRLTIPAPSVIRDNAAPVNRSLSGYGSRIPTAYRVRTIDSRWRRVYCAIYSNSGTLYVFHKGYKTIVDFASK
jgi:hypothetical protein